MCFLNQNCYYDNEEDLYQHVDQAECTATAATFTADIIPIMEAHCTRCHRNDRQDGNVNLEGYNNILPYVNDGSLYGTTNHESGYKVMPTSGVKIPFCEIEQLRLWIEAGALNN
ncbi:MAG: hypothetical protein AB8F74_09105 [Saprospiraceae bacterium]